jgi:hypothetical protein
MNHGKPIQAPKPPHDSRVLYIGNVIALRDLA